jgi:hypothetical protein
MTPKTVWECGKCDKCGETVPANNSALLFDIKLDELNKRSSQWLIHFPMDRHLYPTEKCVGSPSRVRLIESFDTIALQAYKLLQSE